MERLRLSEFRIGEKLNWLCESFGDWQSLDSIVRALEEPGKAVELLETEFGSDEDHPINDDIIAWFLEGCMPVQALELWEAHGLEAEYALDCLLREADLDRVFNDDDYLPML